jgi:hypothetical protein
VPDRQPQWCLSKRADYSFRKSRPLLLQEAHRMLDAGRCYETQILLSPYSHTGYAGPPKQRNMIRLPHLWLSFVFLTTACSGLCLPAESATHVQWPKGHTSVCICQHHDLFSSYQLIFVTPCMNAMCHAAHMGCICARPLCVPAVLCPSVARICLFFCRPMAG